MALTKLRREELTRAANMLFLTRPVTFAMMGQDPDLTRAQWENWAAQYVGLQAIDNRSWIGDLVQWFRQMQLPIDGVTLNYLETACRKLYRKIHGSNKSA